MFMQHDEEFKKMLNKSVQYLGIRKSDVIKYLNYIYSSNDKEIKTICTCGNNEVEVMSITEQIKNINGVKVSAAVVTYICPACENMKTEEYYLYKPKTEESKIIKTNRLGLPVISGGGKTMREMYKEKYK